MAGASDEVTARHTWTCPGRRAAAPATEAVAATLIVEGEDAPSGDRVQAGRLVTAAAQVEGEGGKLASLVSLDLVREAMALCGVRLLPGGEEEGEDGGEAPPAEDPT